MNFHSLENANPYSNPIKETIVQLIDSRAPSLLEERKHIFQYSDLFTLLQSSIFNIPQIISEANADHYENASQQSAVSDGMPPTPANPNPCLHLRSILPTQVVLFFASFSYLYSLSMTQSQVM